MRIYDGMNDTSRPTHVYGSYSHMYPNVTKVALIFLGLDDRVFVYADKVYIMTVCGSKDGWMTMKIPWNG